jgi:hypothetical protein
VNVHSFKLGVGALLATSCLIATAQVQWPALGNSALAKQRSARFLAERGFAPAIDGHSRLRNNPAQLLSQARAQYQKLVQQYSSGTQVDTWQPVGPAQVITSAYGAVAGRITSLAADPSDPTGGTVYIGTASGGVWKSTNAAGSPGSVTFLPLTDSFYSSLSQTASATSLSIGAISVQPVAPGATPVLLAGTGNPNDTTASYFGAGILRSIDGGSQWTLITDSSDQLVSGTNSNFSFVGNGFSGFAWGAISGNPVVVAAVSQAQQAVEVNAGDATQSILGIYYSTDLGQTWLMATITDPGGLVQSPQTSFAPCEVSGSRLPCGNAVTSIVWNPIRHEFLAAVRFHGYYSSPDGQNWTRLTNQPGPNLTTSMCPANHGYSGSQACPIYNGALAVQPVTGDTFALTTDINNLDQGLFQDNCNLSSGSCASSTLTFGQIADSVLDAGSLNPTQPTLIPQADYDLYLAAVPTQHSGQPDTLLFAGTADIYRCDLTAGCAWRNTTHAQSSDCNSAQVAPAQYAIDTTFGASGLLYFGNDGGVWRSTDAVNQQAQQCSADDATHYQNLNFGFTSSIAEVDDVALDPANAQNLMVSLGPLGTAAPLGAASSWQQVLNGEGDYAAIDPANPQNWYATSEFGIGINRCTSGSSCGIAAFGSPVIDSTDVGNDGYGQIIPAPWILDPQNSANIILGTCRVWRGPASGGPQTQLSTMLDGDNGPYCDGNAEIRTLAASGKSTDQPGAQEAIYAGMAGLYDGGSTVAGHVFAQSVGSGTTPSPWIDLSYDLNNFNPNGYDISSIYVDPHSAGGQTVYVAIQGFGSLHLYQSTDGGSIWQDVSRGLLDAPVNSVVVDPDNANIVYVGTDAGVFFTQNIGSCTQLSSSCWSPFGSSLPNVPVTKLVVEGIGTSATLVASTYGRGVWQIALNAAASTTASVAPSSLVFGNQQLMTTSAPKQLLVTNTGSLPLQVASMSVSPGFTETDTCTGESVDSGHACVIEVSFAPTQLGPYSGLLTVYGNLIGGGQLTVPLTGTGIPGAAVTLTPADLCFQAALIGQTTSASCQGGSTMQQVQSIVIANTGGTAAALTSVSIAGDFAIAANTCGKSLAPANTAGDSCTLNITFTPTSPGTRTGVLIVVDSSGTQTAQLTGTGQNEATDTLTPLGLTFSPQTVGVASATQQLTLTNSGDQSVQSIAVQSSSPDFIGASNCGTALAGHSSCAILVSFVPSEVGPETAVVSVSDVIPEGVTSDQRTQQVALSGTGVAPASVVSVSPSSLNFAQYSLNQTSPPQTITITNNGGSTLTGIQSPIVTGDFAIAPGSNTCGSSLSAAKPDNTCTMSVTFTPTAVGSRTGTLTFIAANLSPQVISLTGTGTSAAFTMWVSGSASTVITNGQNTTFTIDMSGPKGVVTLTCSVAPNSPNVSCPNPSPVSLTGISTASTTIAFSSAQQAGSIESNWRGTSVTLALLVPLGFLARRRRFWIVLAVLAAFALLLPIGCGISSSAGSGSTGGSGSSPTSAQYTLTVTGSMASGAAQSVTMQVNVE